VLAYRIKLAARFAESPDSQHELLEWLDIDELLSRPDVHENVKAYFI
jgi:colanic acid biosynthesis protein WcaH